MATSRERDAEYVFRTPSCLNLRETMRSCPLGAGECPVTAPGEEQGLGNQPPGARLPWRPWQIFRFTVGYLSHALADLGFFLLMVPLTAVLAFLPRYRHRLIRWLVSRYLALLFHRWLPALGIYRIDEVSGLDRAGSEAPAVFVANHRGRLDGPLLLSYIQQAGVIIKSRYARRGTLAFLARVFDFVPIDTGSLDSVATMAAKCRRLIEQGTNLLVFPEGSRSQSGRLLPFRNIAFRLAIEQGRPVVPVIVHSTVPFMTKESSSFYPREPIRFRFRFMPPQWPAVEETPDDMASRVYRLMARELRDLDRGTAWASRQGLRL